MSRLLLVLVLTLFGAQAKANPNDDAAFFMTYFVSQANWDRMHRMMKQRSPRFYRDAFIERNVSIVDEDRFRDLMPDQAAEDAVKLIKSNAVDFIADHYGADNLSEIASFFRSPTGEKMLKVARDKGLFNTLFYRSVTDLPVQHWRSHLSPLELSRYNAFANSEAGRIFVKKTFVIRKALFYQFNDMSKWPTPPLNRPYVVDILKAEGVLRFPNRVVRQSLIRELSVSSP